MPYFCKKYSIMGIADKLSQMKSDNAAANLKAGQDFLEANKSKEGVVALPSGLQYEVTTMGEGAKPLATNKVTCHYHGTLIDGTIFDSSVQRGQPATFPLNMVIKGWTEGLQLMPMGSKWRFFIPADLGYGNRQVSAEIGPNSTLISEVELLGIN
jgi:FKBP-type peptidyl-prolyl cis-trans isomerase FklB